MSLFSKRKLTIGFQADTGGRTWGTRIAYFTNGADESVPPMNFQRGPFCPLTPLPAISATTCPFTIHHTSPNGAQPDHLERGYPSAAMTA